MREMEYQVSEKRKKVVEDLLALPQVQQALKDIKEDHEHSLEEQKMLALIASPTFHGQEKKKKMVSLFEELDADSITAKLSQEYPEEDIREVIEEVRQLKEDGQLFTEDIYQAYVEKFKETRQTVVKALSLHTAHD